MRVRRYGAASCVPREPSDDPPTALDASGAVNIDSADRERDRALTRLVSGILEVARIVANPVASGEYDERGHAAHSRRNL